MSELELIQCLVLYFTRHYAEIYELLCFCDNLLID